MAGLFERLGVIGSAKADEIVSSMEDPGKVADAWLLKAKKEYAKNKEVAAQVFVMEGKAKDAYETCKANIDKWTKVAEGAVRAGNDEDATRALTKVSEFEANLPNLKAAYDRAHKQTEDIKTKLNAQAKEIQKAEGKVAAIKADAANAKVAQTINKGVMKNGALGEFDRLSEKAKGKRIAAEAMGDMDFDADDNDLLDKYSTSNSDVADRLAAMKEKLGGSN